VTRPRRQAPRRVPKCAISPGDSVQSEVGDDSLGLRMDWGPQYTAHQFLGELRWLGIRPSPSYVGEPECNGIMERWIRTLKEECLYLHDFATLDEARQLIGAFIERYNRAWLLERHGHRTPAEVRASLTRRAA